MPLVPSRCLGVVILDSFVVAKISVEYTLCSFEICFNEIFHSEQFCDRDLFEGYKGLMW